MFLSWVAHNATGSPLIASAAYGAVPNGESSPDCSNL